MADRKITDLTALAAGSQATGDLLTIVDVSESAAADKNKKITTENFFKGIPGDVGIGTSSPDSPFHVNGGTVNTVGRFESTDSVSRIVLKDNSGEIRVGATGDNITFHTSSSETERMRIDSSGNVGIGQTSPAHELHVADAATPEIVVEDTTNNCKAYIGSSDTNGRIGTLSNHDLAFRTNDTERMRIDSSGNIGIGTTTPGTVTGSGIDLERNGPATLRLNDTSGNGAVVEIFADDGNMSAVYDSRGHSSNHGHQFRVNGSEKARINSSGNVGIGETSPLGNLHVKSGDSGASSVGASADELVIEGSGNSGMTILSGNSNQALINFADSGDVNVGNITYDHGSNFMSFKTNDSEQMRIDSAGRLLLGLSTSSSVGYDHALQIEGTAGADSGLSLIRNSNDDNGPGIDLASTRGTSIRSNTVVQSGDTLGNIVFRGADGTDKATIAASIQGQVDGTPGSNDMPGRLVFKTTRDGESTATERIRIDSAGAITTDNSAYAFLRSDSTTTASLTLRKDDSGADGVDYFQCRNTANTLKLVIEGDGDVKNANNSYGQTSDRKLKENIVDASSQWSDIKNLQVRNFNFTEASGYPTHTQIGLVAQEVETVSPGLVSESIDRDEESNDLGTTTKGVKYSVLYIKAVKALQEAMDRIETLEAKVAALEAQ